MAMNEARRNLLVGLFVLFGLGAIGFLIIAFGQVPELFIPQRHYIIQIKFERAAGIRRDTLVTIGGLEVGRVQQVAFKNPDNPGEGVRVTVRLDPQYRIRAGSTAKTMEPGLGMGRPPIEIEPAKEGEFLASGGEITGTIATATSQLVPESLIVSVRKTSDEFRLTAEAMQPVLLDLHELLRPRPPQEVDQEPKLTGNLASAAARLDELLKHFNEVLGDPQVRSQLREGIANLHGASEELKQTVQDARAGVGEFRQLATRGQQSLERLDENVDRVSRAAVNAMDQASAGLSEITQIAGMIRQGQGTLGRLTRDERLYEALVLTAQRLALAIEDFQKLVNEWRQGRVRVTAF